MGLKNVDEILDFAIWNEQKAYDFYMALAEQAPSMKATFEGYAKEELGHKAKLEKIKTAGTLQMSAKVEDLKIADYTVDVEPSPDMDYQDALILAMKQEKAAYKLYTTLAERTDDHKLKLIFLALAQEEAKHKLRFEVAYDEDILTEN